jgi:prepilin-type processing-associated H-X9-DG protein
MRTWTRAAFVAATLLSCWAGPSSAAPLAIGTFSLVVDPEFGFPLLQITNDTGGGLDATFSQVNVLFCDGSVRTLGDGSVVPADPGACDGAATVLLLGDGSVTPADPDEQFVDPFPAGADFALALFSLIGRSGVPLPGIVRQGRPIDLARSCPEGCEDSTALYYDARPDVVPAPTATALLGVGLAVFAARRRTGGPRFTLPLRGGSRDRSEPALPTVS